MAENQIKGVQLEVVSQTVARARIEQAEAAVAWRAAAPQTRAASVLVEVLHALIDPGRMISLGLAARFSLPGFAKALCWLVIPNGRPVEGYTSCDVDILFESDEITFDGGELVGEVLYRSAGGMITSDIPVNINLSSDMTDLSSLLHMAGITREKAESGVYKDARILIFALDPENLDLGMVKLTGGRLENLEASDTTVLFELANWATIANRNMGRIMESSCPWRFGYGNCRNTKGLNDGPAAEDITEEGTVAAYLGKTHLRIAGIAKPTDWATDGVLRFTDAEFLGAEFDILKWELVGGEYHLYLMEVLPFTPYVGQTVAIEEGCDHTIYGTRGCITKPNSMQPVEQGNIVNNGGFPFGLGEKGTQRPT